MARLQGWRTHPLSGIAWTCTDDRHLWSERFDRGIADVCAVQEEIATGRFSPAAHVEGGAELTGAGRQEPAGPGDPDILRPPGVRLVFPLRYAGVARLGPAQLATYAQISATWRLTRPAAGGVGFPGRSDR
jgi:hypothetical protein